MLFNKNLRYLVGISKYPKTTIAKDIGVSYAKLESYLKITHCRLDVLIKLSKYFEISIDDLLTRDIETKGYSKHVTVYVDNDTNFVATETPQSNYGVKMPATSLDLLFENRMKAIAQAKNNELAAIFKNVLCELKMVAGLEVLNDRLNKAEKELDNLIDLEE